MKRRMSELAAKLLRNPSTRETLNTIINSGVGGKFISDGHVYDVRPSSPAPLSLDIRQKKRDSA